MSEIQGHWSNWCNKSLHTGNCISSIKIQTCLTLPSWYINHFCNSQSDILWPLKTFDLYQKEQSSSISNTIFFNLLLNIHWTYLQIFPRFSVFDPYSDHKWPLTLKLFLFFYLLYSTYIYVKFLPWRHRLHKLSSQCNTNTSANADVYKHTHHQCINSFCLRQRINN